MRVNDTEKGASLAVKKNSVNSDVIDSIDDYSLYLAEEIAYDIIINPSNELDFGQEARVAQNKSITFNAQVVNQINIPGTLDQSVSWKVVTADRKNIAENITAQTEGQSVTLSCGEDVTPGKYAIVAVSEKYNIIKGFEFYVTEDESAKYKDFSAYKIENKIKTPGNSGFAAKTGNITYDNASSNGYVTIEAKSDIQSDLGAEGLKIKNMGDGFPTSFNFEAGKTYFISAKVRNANPDVEAYFNASMSDGTKNALAMTNEYGEQGMLLTKDWKEFKASITVSENYKAAWAKKSCIIGFSNGTKAGAKADIELSVVVGDIKENDISLEAKANAVIGENDSFKAKASVLSNLGTANGMKQNFEWYLLDSEKTDKTDALEIKVSKDTQEAEVVTDIYSQAGVYYLVAQSKDYSGFVKSVKFTVDKPSAEECVKALLKTAEKDELAKNLEEYLKALKITTDIEDINYENLAEIIVGSRSGLTDENTESFLKKAIVISAYEDANGLYNSDGKFKYDDLLNLKELDKDGVTLYSLFTDNITAEGRKEIQKALQGEYKTFEEFEKAFAEEVILKAIKYPSKSGMGTLELILTEKNAKAAGIDIDEYLELDNKTDAAKYILNKTFTKETLEKAIDNIEKTIKDGNKTDSKGNGSSSSSGGGTINIAPSTPITKDNETNSGENNILESVSFKDVSEEHWAYRDINYLAKINVIAGMGDGMFEPDKTVTREQFVKMICEAFEYELINERTEFSDVEAGAWYEKYIATAVKKEIITGIGDGKFGVGCVITREDMCVVINRALGENSAGDLESEFTDMDNVAAYAKDSVVYLSSIGVINGYGNGSFGPKQECTRAQSAKIICTVLNLKGEE